MSLKGSAQQKSTGKLGQEGMVVALQIWGPFEEVVVVSLQYLKYISRPRAESKLTDNHRNVFRINYHIVQKRKTAEYMAEFSVNPK